MGYSREIYDEVQKKLYNKRISAWEELTKKKEIIYKRFPRAAEIEKDLSSTAIKVAKSVLKGANASDEIRNLKLRNKILHNELVSILKSVNLPEDYLEIKFECEKCSDEGFVDGRMCECMKNMLKYESYNKLNRMSPLELSSFDNFSLDYYSDVPSKDGQQSPQKRMSLILNFCRKYANNFNKHSPSLLLTGSTGLGKTHLSLAIASEVINKGYAVIYGSTQNMISSMEKERFQNYRENNETEQHFIDCDLLIIDDLGTEFLSSFSTAAIYNVINSRIMMNKPTIISTNLSMRELEKCYTQRMVSRIIGNNIRLEFLGSDIRQKRLRESFKDNREI